MTDDNNPVCFDQYLMDSEIKTILRHYYDESVLNADFKSAYPEFADLVYGGPHYTLQQLRPFSWMGLMVSFQKGHYQHIHTADTHICQPQRVPSRIVLMESGDLDFALLTFSNSKRWYCVLQCSMPMLLLSLPSTVASS